MDGISIRILQVLKEDGESPFPLEADYGGPWRLLPCGRQPCQSAVQPRSVSVRFSALDVDGTAGFELADLDLDSLDRKRDESLKGCQGCVEGFRHLS